MHMKLVSSHPIPAGRLNDRGEALVSNHTFSPVTSSSWRFSSCSVGGAAALSLGSPAILSDFCSAVCQLFVGQFQNDQELQSSFCTNAG